MDMAERKASAAQGRLKTLSWLLEAEIALAHPYFS
jgi:hypothetical protein